MYPICSIEHYWLRKTWIITLTVATILFPPWTLQIDSDVLNIFIFSAQRHTTNSIELFIAVYLASEYSQS